jgi:hypothetical protein
MKKQFDVAIIGDNLQAALLVHEAIDNGLSVINVVNENEAISIDNEPFIVFKYICLIKFPKRIRQNKILQYLKTNATHLLLTTEIEEYKKLSVFELILFHFNNLFSKYKVKIKKLGNSDKLHQLNYSSYKISANRLHQVILKSIDKTKFETIRTGKSYEKKDNSEKIIDTSETSFPKTYGSYLTYPNSYLKLGKTILLYNKNISIKIIPWFEYVYFGLNGKNTPKTIKESIILVKQYLPEIDLEEEKVLFFEPPKQLKESTQINDPETYNDLIIKTLTKLSFWKKSPVLSGSDFGIPYHPLRIMEFCDEKYDEAKHILQDPQFFKKLFYRYGIEIDKITYQAYEFWNQTKDIKKTWLMAELWYVVNYEQCASPDKFLYKHTEEWMNVKETDKELIKSLYEELTNKQ